MIADLPDNETAAAVALAVNGSEGALVQTVVLMTPEELDAASKKEVDFRPAGGILGTGGELIWSKPVRPGDALRVEIEIIETRPSRSRPEQGVVKVQVTTLNHHGETVQTFSPTLLVDRRPDSVVGQR